MDVLPNIFWVPRDSGSLVDLRIRAHDGGRGERVAHRLGLTQAQAIVRAVSAHDDLVRELDVRVGDLVMLRKAIEAGDPRNELFVRIDDMLRETRAALAKAGA